jgi:hypothetical protein
VVGHRGIFDVFLAEFTKENATMTLDQSALTDLLDALRSGGDLDFMREPMQLVLAGAHRVGGIPGDRRRPL